MSLGQAFFSILSRLHTADYIVFELLSLYFAGTGSFSFEMSRLCLAVIVSFSFELSSLHVAGTGCVC